MQDSNIKKLWHTNRKCFIKGFSILQTINSEGEIEHTYFEYNPKTKELEKLSTCQIIEINCTGLKDKNIKLIFEGDIVKVYNHVGQIIYDQRGCYFGLKVSNSETWGFSLNFMQHQHIEVLGSIYKNPELLEAKE